MKAKTAVESAWEAFKRDCNPTFASDDEESESLSLFEAGFRFASPRSELEVVLVDNTTVCVPKHVAREILKLREKLRMIRSLANE